MLALVMLAQALVLGRIETGAPGHVIEVTAGPCIGGARAIAVADVWRGERIVWDAHAHRMIRSPMPAVATIAGTYSSVAAARTDQQSASAKCRRVRLLALETNALRLLSPKKFVLATISANERDAR